MKTCNPFMWNSLSSPKTAYGEIWCSNDGVQKTPYDLFELENNCYASKNVNYGFEDQLSSRDPTPRTSTVEIYSAYSHNLSDCASDRFYDHNLFDVLKVEPETYARQITLIELNLFQKITIDEFLSFKWNSKDKAIHAPNIVASTKWFNQLIFWVQREILNVANVNKRVEVLSLFIRIAKCLEHMNNLYSSMAIVSSLQVQCIHRLKQTWSALPHKDKTSFKRLEQLFSAKDNSQALREHTDNMKLPGIPYLGIYLSDLTFINTAFPAQGEFECRSRDDKINNILRIITNFQQSDYSHFLHENYIQNYLKSQRYIEELQKFIEDTNYKLSLTLEPDCPIISSDDQLLLPPASSSDNRESPCKVLQPLPAPSTLNDDPEDSIAHSQLSKIVSRSDSCHSTLSQVDTNLTPSNKPDSCHLINQQSSANSKSNGSNTAFKLPLLKPNHKKRPSQDYASNSAVNTGDNISLGKGHRKSKSVGTEKQTFPTGLGSKCSSKSSNQTTNLLDDSPVNNDCNGDNITPDNLSLHLIQPSEQTIFNVVIGIPELSPHDVICECSIQRKTIRVNGRPTRFTMWHRFWIVLARTEQGAIIYYFKAKTFRAVNRNQFSKSKRKEQLLNEALTLIKSPVMSHQCKRELTQPVRYFHLIDSEHGKTYLIRSVQPRSHHDALSTYDLYLRITEAIKVSVNKDEDLINLEEDHVT